MKASEKISSILNYLDINAKVFSEKLGYKRPQIIYDILSDKTKSISNDLAIKITSLYPVINKAWLLADEGEMIKADYSFYSVHKSVDDETILSRIQMIADNEGITITALERNIGASKGVLSRAINNNTDIQSKWLLSIVDNYPIYSGEWLLTGNGNMTKDVTETALDTTTNKATTQEIPLIPYTAPIGFLSKLLEGATQLDCEMIPSPIKDAQIAIQVMGESMLPEYMGGDILLLRKVDERIFIEWGMCYILDTHNGVVLKRVMPGKTKDTITCESYNDKYPPFEVKLSDIIGFYKVVMTMRKKTI